MHSSNGILRTAKVLARRDNITEDAAIQELEQWLADIDWSDPDTVAFLDETFADDFGLEPDYLLDILM